EDRGELPLEVGARYRRVDDDAFAADRIGLLAVERESDPVDVVELSEGAHDLRDAKQHRQRAAARRELRTQVDGGDTVFDRDAVQGGAGGDRRAQPELALLIGGSVEKRLERRVR